MNGYKCPHCGEPHTASTSITDLTASPTRGDVSICIHCARVAIFTGPDRMRKPRPGELAEIERRDDVRRAQAAVIFKLSLGDEASQS